MGINLNNIHNHFGRFPDINPSVCHFVCHCQLCKYFLSQAFYKVGDSMGIFEIVKSFECLMFGKMGEIFIGKMGDFV